MRRVDRFPALLENGALRRSFCLIDHHPVPEERDPQPAPDNDPMGAFLKRIDLRMERQNRRMLHNLTAWAEILDALGWRVALWLPGREPMLSTKAREWASEQSALPMEWEEITARLTNTPPARQLIQTAQVRVWAEAEGNGTGDPDPFGALTKRETEVLGWLREGKTGPEIAIILGCARRTVESHVARLYKKLGVSHRAGLLFNSAPTVR